MRIIAGSARGKPLVAPVSRTTRPALDSLREAIFARIGDRVENSRVLDLFAGIGAFGLEAISRGARHATFVERDAAALRSLDENIRRLCFVQQVTVIRGDALRQPSTTTAADPASAGAPATNWNLIFYDPPFALFEDSSDTHAVLARLVQLSSSPRSEADALFVVRLPCEYRGEVPFTDPKGREYGRSRVWVVDRTEIVSPRADS
jgi:16S rRNA (guanine966-N2)-methyltransferase